MDFGPRFKKILKEKGISQSQFCENYNLNQGLVSRYCSGEKPSVDFIYTVIEAFPDVDLDYLFSKDDELNMVQETEGNYTKSSLNIIKDIEKKLSELKKNVTQMTH